MNYNLYFKEFRPQKKCGLETIAIIGIAAAGAAVAGSVASGIATNSAQSSANDTNIRLAREQMAYQTSERLATQEYNTPAAQRERFEAAGINPYMALGQMDVGNTSMQSGVTPAHVQPLTGLSDMLSGLGMAPMQVMQAVSMAEQVQGQKEAVMQARIETLYKERKEIAALRESVTRSSETLSKISKNSAEYDIMRKQLLQQEQDLKMKELDAKYHEDYLQARNKRERNTADLVAQQERHTLLQNWFQEQTNAFLPMLQELQAKELGASIFAKYQQGLLSQKQGYLTDEQKKHEALKAVGTEIANAIAGNEKLRSEYGLTEARLKALRDGAIERFRNDNVLFEAADNIANWACQIPLQYFK